MKRTLIALAATCTLAASAASADRRSGDPAQYKHGESQQRGEGTQRMEGGEGAQRPEGGEARRMARADEAKKHLTGVDLYLHDSLNNVKIIWNTTQLAPGNLDASLHKESLNNIEQSLSSALNHLAQLKAMPEPRITDIKKVDEVRRQLSEARGMLGRLRAAVKEDARAEIRTLAGQLHAQLRSSDEAFGELARQVNLTRIDQLDVGERQPVRGPSPEGEEPGAAEEPPPSGGPDVTQPPRTRGPGQQPGGEKGPREGM